MPTPHSFKIIVAAIAIAPAMSGCALFGIQQQRDAQAAYEKQVADSQAAMEKAQRENERQLAIAQARTELLEETLDAKQYDVQCDALVSDVEKVVIKIGRSVTDRQGELMITDWSHQSARYEANWYYEVRKTRAASKNRYVIELKDLDAEDGCKVEATFQYANDDGAQSADRALDFEARVMQELDPEGYAKLEAEYTAMERKFPAS
ncbi:MAG: hypothetical protein AAF721_36010 [Myxococcota bacterium]